MTLIKSAIFTAALLSAGAASAAEFPLGDYARGDGHARVKIAKCGADICATNTWVSGKKDESVGDALVMKLKEASPTKFTGSAYDTRRKATYSMNVTVADGRLTSSGCVLSGILCKSENWTRVGGQASR